MQAQASYRVLMNRVQIRIGSLRPGLLIQRLKLPHGGQTTRFLLLRVVKFGSVNNLTVLVDRVQHRYATVAHSHDRIVRYPGAAQKRQIFRT